MLKWIIIIISLVVVAICYACCVVSGDADKRSQELYQDEAADLK